MDDTVRMLDSDPDSATYRKELRKLEKFPTAFSPDSRTMIIASEDGNTFGIFDTDSGKELQQWEGQFLAFSPDGKKIAIANDNGIVRVWTLP